MISAKSPVVRKHQPDFKLLFIAVALTLIGLVLMFALSPTLAKIQGPDIPSHYYTLRQFLAVGVGIVAFLISININVKTWLKLNKFILIAAAIASILIAIPGSPFRITINGASRWFSLGAFSFQPAELIKFGLLFYLSSFISVRAASDELEDKQKTLYPLAAILGLTAFVVTFLQKDMGSMVVIVVMVAMMLYFAGLRLRMMAQIAAILVVPVIFFIAIAPHRIDRLLTFASSDKDCQGSGYQVCQSLIAVGSGGVGGVGLGRSVQATGYLPEASTDSIFSIFAEKFGFIGSVLLLSIFLLLLIRILDIAAKTVNPEARLMVVGVFAWFSAHVFMNVGAMLSLMPLKGITLPLISYGGTSILFMMAALGVVFHISKYTSLQAVQNDKQAFKPAPPRERNSGRRLVI